VGDIIVTPNQMAQDLPIYPIRAFMIREDGTYEVVYRTPLTTIKPIKATLMPVP